MTHREYHVYFFGRTPGPRVLRMNYEVTLLRGPGSKGSVKFIETVKIIIVLKQESRKGNHVKS